MMREAQKMMQDPAFQAHMDKMMQNAGFQQAMNKTKDALSDPETAKQMEEKAQKAVEEGNALLEKRQRVIENLRKAQAEQEAKEKAEAAKKAGEESEEETTNKEEEDKKPAAEEEEDDIPDIPALNLN